MSKHTPRPWVFHEKEVMEDGSVFPDHITGGIFESQVCMIESPELAKLRHVDASWSSPESDNMRKANARLIAAAPDLLEALQDIIDTGFAGGPQAKRAKAAIAKATGEQ